MSTHCPILPSFFLIFLAFFCYTSYAYTFTVTNNCPYTIWPGTLSGAGTPQLSTTGFQLDSGQSVRIPSVPAGWSGRIWGRTGCSFDATGVGLCQTGDCGGKLACNGNGATPPASLFEITFGVGNLQDFYDVSFVDGYNLPLVAAPRGVYGACNATGCAYDLNMVFKKACPKAYSYAYDDASSTFTCKALDYLIIFCPNSRSQRANRTNGGFTPPSNDDGTEGKVQIVSNSSNLPFPFPILILLLLVNLFF
ncbi:hypothetical protein Gotur_007382 [Gossypium turneri]